jgi:hypothetical protein
MARAPALSMVRVGLDGGDNDDALRLGPPEQADRTAADDLPASALREPAPVGTDRRVGGPPVGEVFRLGEQRPDLRAGREELGLGIDAHGLVIVTIPARSGH